MWLLVCERVEDNSGDVFSADKGNLSVSASSYEAPAFDRRLRPALGHVLCSNASSIARVTDKGRREPLIPRKEEIRATYP